MAQRICSLPDCGNPFLARGLCSKHYWRLKRHGDVGPPTIRVCSVEGCGGKHVAIGLCSLHYQRQWLITHPRQPTEPRPKKPQTVRSNEAFFWARVNPNGPIPSFRPDLGPCWIWTVVPNTDGYARFTLLPERRTIGAHRFSYELLVGPIPSGLVPDHLCRVRNCVNPHHLEAVTRAENQRRGGRLYTGAPCKNGHPISDSRLQPSGKLVCRECERESIRRYLEKKRAREQTAA